LTVVPVVTPLHFISLRNSFFRLQFSWSAAFLSWFICSHFIVMKKRVWKNILLIALFSGFVALVDNPWKFPPWEKDIPVVTPLWNWIQESQVSLGLDLQGGTKLDYEIELTDARQRNSDEDPDNDVDISALLNGVKDVIEKRVNSLGVAEPNIYLSSAGEEEHIVIELPGVKDIREAKEKVGKVVQLEFKTEKAEPTAEEVAQISRDASELLKKIQAEDSIEDLEAYVEDIQVPNQVEYRKEEKAFIDELPQEFQPLVKTLQPNTFYREVVRAKEATYIFNDGQLQQPEGFNIIRLLESAPELRKRPVNAEDFAAVAEEMGGQTSEDYFHFDEIQPSELANEVSALETSEVSGVIDTKQGFYIAKMNQKLAADESAEAEDQIRTAHILFKTQPLETLQEEKALKEVPENASEEEKAKIEAENQTIAQENERVKEQNAAIKASNEEAEAKNAEAKALAESVL